MEANGVELSIPCAVDAVSTLPICQEALAKTVDVVVDNMVLVLAIAVGDMGLEADSNPATALETAIDMILQTICKAPH